MDQFQTIIDFFSDNFVTKLTIEQFLIATLQTFMMTFVALVIGSLLGIPLGICLVVTRNGGLLENRYIFKILNTVINIIRSLPFIILLIAIIPITVFIVRKSIGTGAVIVPLTFFVAPYIARLIENSLLEVKSGIIEAAKSMGATPIQIIWHFMLPEAFSSIILTLTTATIGLVNASAMAGAVGGGGLGDLAINYGYRRYDTFAMMIIVCILIVIVQLLQSIGNYLAKKARHE